MNLKVIAFDADDTLFVNEPYFQEVEQKFCALLSDYLSQQGLSQELFRVEIENLDLYGYGIKGYTLSMIEAAMKISNKTISMDIVEKIIDYGKELLQKPIVLLDGVEETLAALQGKYKLIVATKGDLKDNPPLPFLPPFPPPESFEPVSKGELSLSLELLAAGAFGSAAGS